MHHLKETTIDGVKFVLIPEQLYECLKTRAKEYVQATGFGESLLDFIAEFEVHPYGL